MKRIALGGLLLALSLCSIAIAGCSDDDDGAEALSEQDYVAQANEICREGNAELDQAAKSVQGGPGSADFDAFITDTLAPNIQDQIDGLREGIPEGDEERINGVLDDAEAVLDELEADPSLITNDPFVQINKQLDSYGLAACAG
jgi:hypothetical protein